MRAVTVQTPRSVKEGRRCSRYHTEVPLQPVDRTIVMLSVPLQPREEPMLEQVDVPRRKMQLVEKNPSWSRFVEADATCGGPMLEQSFPEGLRPIQRSSLGRNASHRRYPALQQGKSMRKKEHQR